MTCFLILTFVCTFRRYNVLLMSFLDVMTYFWTFVYTLLAKKLCDSSFLVKNLDLIILISSCMGLGLIIFLYIITKVVCCLVWCVFWYTSLKGIMSFLSHKCSSIQCVLNCGLRTYFGITIIVPLIRARR